MLFDNLSFVAMQRSLNALSMRQETIVHNLANLETPGYKAKRVDFQSMLQQAEASQDAGHYDFSATVRMDEAASVRPDGNNVDYEKENMELMETYFQTLALYQKIGGQITDTRYVIKQAFK